MSRLQRWDETGVPLLAARLVVGAAFIALGSLKAGDLVEFLKLLRQYDMAPDGRPWLLNALAAFVPWIEIWCGLLLVLGVAVRGASLAAVLLVSVFSVAIAGRGAELARQGGVSFCAVAFDCGCGTGVVNVCSKLAQNAVLWGLCWVGLLSRSRRFCLSRGLA